MTLDRKGRIILLNGASSSGKSSIGRALLPLLPDPWFLAPVDVIGAMRSTVHTRILDDAAISEMLKRTRLGYHRAVAGLASAGNDVIMDYPLSEQWRLDDLLKTLEPYDVTLVEVRCSPAELERRERDRGDRPVGLSRSQAMVYTHGECDITVDTTSASANECATTIVNGLGAISPQGVRSTSSSWHLIRYRALTKIKHAQRGPQQRTPATAAKVPATRDSGHAGSGTVAGHAVGPVLLRDRVVVSQQPVPDVLDTVAVVAGQDQRLDRHRNYVQHGR